MVDYLTDYEHSLPNNIICGPAQQISIMYSKINIYNGDNNHPLQRYWFLLKNVKIIEYNNNYVKIALSNSIPDKKFIEYINNLDNGIHKMICDLLKLNLCKQISYSNDKYSPISLTLNKFFECIMFDENNRKITKLTKDKYINHTLSILIELSDIIVGDDKYWINYTAKQLKVNKSICNQKSIFELITESTTKTIIDPSPPLPAPQLAQNRVPPVPPAHNHIPTQNYVNIGKKNVGAPVRKFIISINDLQDQINKMRNSKLHKEEEKMRTQVENMKKEIIQFKNNQEVVSDKYKSIVESLN